MFCKYCGKEIPEGQTCDCQESAAPVDALPAQEVPAAPVEPTAAAESAAQATVAVDAPPAAPTGPDIGKIVGDAFKGMPAAAKHLLGNTNGAGVDIPSAVIFAVGGLVLHILAWICFAGGLLGDLKSAMGFMGGYVDEMFEGVYGMAVGAGCLGYLVPLALVVAILVVGQLLRKEKIDIVSCFISGASTQVLPAVILLVGGLLSLINFGLGGFVSLVAIMAGVVVFHKLLVKLVKHPGTAVSGLLIAALLAVVVGIVASAVSGVVTGYVQNTLAADLGDLLGMF